MKLKNKTIKTIGKIIFCTGMSFALLKGIMPKTTNAQYLNNSYYSNNSISQVDVKKLDVELNERGQNKENILELTEGIEFIGVGSDLNGFVGPLTNALLTSSKNLANYAANYELFSNNLNIIQNFINEIQTGIIPLLSEIDTIYVTQANQTINRLNNNEINLRQAFLEIFGRDPHTGEIINSGIDPLVSSLIITINEEKSDIIMQPTNSYFVRGVINPEALCPDGSKPRYRGIVFEKATLDGGITIYKPVSENIIFKDIINEFIGTTICTNLRSEFQFEITPLQAYVTAIAGLNQNLKYREKNETINYEEDTKKIKVKPRSRGEVGFKLVFQNANFGNSVYLGLGTLYGDGFFVNATRWEELQGGGTLFLQFPNFLTLQGGVNAKVERIHNVPTYSITPVARADLNIGNQDDFSINLIFQSRDNRYFGSVVGGNKYLKFGLTGSAGEGNSSLGLSAEWIFCDILFN